MCVYRQLEEPPKTVFKRKSTVGNPDESRPRSSSAGWFGRSGASGTANGSKDVELATYTDDTTNPLSLAHYSNANSVSLPKGWCDELYYQYWLI